MSATDNNNNIDWNEVVKKEARGINDADFGEVQLTIGDTVITERHRAVYRWVCRSELSCKERAY
jgi:hypothetical protein